MGLIETKPVSFPQEQIKIFFSVAKGKFEPVRTLPFDRRPRLKEPRVAIAGSLQPARTFINSNLIPYILTESLESPHPRKLPPNLSLIRALSKGKGILRKNEKGLIYLSIDDKFIDLLLPYLEPRGLTRSPNGAQIPVIREDLPKIAELGTSFSFGIEGLYSLEPDSWPEMEEVWFLKVRSPELEALRRKYFLTKLPGGNSFYIVVAVKKNKVNKPTPLIRINPSFMQA